MRHLPLQGLTVTARRASDVGGLNLWLLRFPHTIATTRRAGADGRPASRGAVEASRLWAVVAELPAVAGGWPPGAVERVAGPDTRFPRALAAGAWAVGVDGRVAGRGGAWLLWFLRVWAGGPAGVGVWWLRALRSVAAGPPVAGGGFPGLRVVEVGRGRGLGGVAAVVLVSGGVR
ncbi:hypothetical protein GCM10009639_46000 [Kitasatospora putterlickiae]|uniref:Uncharacterized protein n=1 Tax=Kitasatospora putterlickiae TaxID=221725 RepID=A0ABN1YCD9_9ACTN